MRLILPERSVIGIDPGPVESAAVTLMPDGTIDRARMVENYELAHELSCYPCDDDRVAVVETLSPMGQALGQESLDTHGWAWVFSMIYPGKAYRLSRRQVMTALQAGRDASVCAACLDLLGYDSRSQAVGTKKKPGPLYGIKKHFWQALGVALAWVVLTGSIRRKGLEAGR